MFDHIGLLSIGLVFGIILMFFFNSIIGLAIGTILGVSLMGANFIEQRRHQKYAR